jgi:hypothetical protein
VVAAGGALVSHRPEGLSWEAATRVLGLAECGSLCGLRLSTSWTSPSEYVYADSKFVYFGQLYATRPVAQRDVLNSNDLCERS